MEPSVKVNLMNRNKEYIIQRFGQEAYDKMLQEMPSKDRAIFSKAILGPTWIPERAHVNFLIAAEKCFGKGDYEICRQIGIYSASQNIPRVYAFFVRFGNPAFILENASKFWRQVHTHGHLKIVSKTAKTAVTQLIGFPCPSKAFCAANIGFCTKALELCGAKNVSIRETQCAAEGADYCESVVTWE